MRGNGEGMRRTSDFEGMRTLSKESGVEGDGRCEGFGYEERIELVDEEGVRNDVRG